LFKSIRLINLEEEISRQSSIQGVSWVLMAAFSQVWSNNPEQKALRRFEIFAIWSEKPLQSWG
jgi:hypothetical protein